MLKFSQVAGFVVTELPIEAKNMEDSADWRERAGYCRTPDSSDGAATPHDSSPIHYYKGKEGDGWLVEVRSGELITEILVDNEAELFALRTKIATPIFTAIADRFEAVAVITEKAFLVWHGHQYYRPCAKCDPEGWKEDRERLERLHKSNRFAKARKTIASMPPAISGSSGHQALFTVARKLVHDFALSDPDALNLLLEYNKRCEPPWSEQELRHKLESARAVVTP